MASTDVVAFTFFNIMAGRRQPHWLLGLKDKSKEFPEFTEIDSLLLSLKMDSDLWEVC